MKLCPFCKCDLLREDLDSNPPCDKKGCLCHAVGRARIDN
jgi:hypothetical protein